MPRKALTRRVRVEEREQAIIAAAREVFTRNGFDGAKVADIARAAGVAEGTVYIYFQNKSALLVAVLREFYEELTAKAAEGVAEIPGTFDRLEFLARHHLESVARAWHILALGSQQYRIVSDYGQTETYQFNRAYVAVFDQVIREGVARGDIREDVPLRLLGDIFYGGLEFASYTLRLRSKRFERLAAPVVADFIRILRTGMAAPAAVPDAAEDEALLSVAARLEQVATRLEQAAPESPQESERKAGMSLSGLTREPIPPARRQGKAGGMDPRVKPEDDG
ncbi:TetR/AcrR family transcriptional regulator [Marinibaculum pumilum]|uniref:TetR/AcrR family transcriptional regulator n=1 Tax=Marinibaculum pumilum TaxID=1766165 RepID=A0ABV7L3L1_9PROT